MPLVSHNGRVRKNATAIFDNRHSVKLCLKKCLKNTDWLLQKAKVIKQLYAIKDVKQEKYYMNLKKRTLCLI